MQFLEELAGHSEADRRVRISTITDPRGMDFCAYQRLKQEDSWADLEHRTIDALRKMGVLMTDTCINYQTISPPVFGEHLAMGDTGVSIYCNGVLGARTNFEGGPAALTAGLTGRVPRYGYHLDEHRHGTHLFEVTTQPKDLSEWGALGGIVGRASGSYWSVPVIAGVAKAPTSDELKHFGAAAASYGSVPMFHMVGVTPEARNIEEVFDEPIPGAQKVTREDLNEFAVSFGKHTDGIDVVVFAAPQLSLMELEQSALLLAGKKVHADTTLLIATSPENKSASDRMGLTEVIEASGAVLLKGVCFYQMHAREMGEANGWVKLLTNSAKLANIISGYGYQPAIATMEECVDAAVRGRQ